jgi:hypothetical protein
VKLSYEKKKSCILIDCLATKLPILVNPVHRCGIQEFRTAVRPQPFSMACTLQKAGANVRSGSDAVLLGAPARPGLQSESTFGSVATGPPVGGRKPRKGWGRPEVQAPRRHSQRSPRARPCPSLVSDTAWRDGSVGNVGLGAGKAVWLTSIVFCAADGVRPPLIAAAAFFPGWHRQRNRHLVRRMVIWINAVIDAKALRLGQQP